jgi:hypothetical protein
MADLLRELFLSPLLIFVVLLFIFIALSYWSVLVLGENTGYVLGWLIGLFVVVVFASLGVQPDVQAQAVDLERATLNIFQVFCSAGIGLIIGISALVFRLISLPIRTPRAVQVAFVTALWVTLMFLMFLVGIEQQRMIGIFALAFCIARLFGVVLSGGHLPRDFFGIPQTPTDGGDPLNPGTGAGGAAENFNALDAKRRNIFNRTRR